MAQAAPPSITIQDASLIFKNFEGREEEYNRPGDRNFCALLTPDSVEAMLQDGWNVKYLRPREEGDDPIPYIPVAVSYKIRPPKVVLITSNGATRLNENSIEILDWSDAKKVDFIARGSHWSTNGKSGVKAYLQTMYYTIQEDELEMMYADVERDLQYMDQMGSADSGDFANE